ncbi:MAG: HAMP domain-containing sensor histidine kinase [Clostridium sp.]|uniref:sensor histidine kinase n=1 Tax=Clostridium sp. TaxID=1506 RepID=UPI0030370F9D
MRNNINDLKTHPIKYKILKPLLIYIFVFSLIILGIFNLIIKHILGNYENIAISSKELFTINIFILIVLLCSIVFFTFLVLKLCNSVAKSILFLSNDAKKLVESTYKTEKMNSFDCEEIQHLNISIHKLAKRLFDYHTSQKIAMANASHELRTPLMSIQGYAEGIKHNVFEDINEPIEIIIEESIHLSDIVKSMLKLSELDSQNAEIDFQSINVYSTLNRFANKLRGLAFKTNKTISIYGDKDIHIETDERLLSEAVINVLSNALRYAKKNITIRFELIHGYILIHIEDDGDGICEEDIEHLFTRFYKGEKGNLGLGLSIAQSSIHYLGGEISAYNLKNGASFDIKLSV